MIYFKYIINKNGGFNVIEKIDNLFRLNGKDVSYIIAVTPSGEAVHSYFGKKLRTRDSYETNFDLAPSASCNVIPNNVSFDKEMMEYSSYGYGDLHTPMYQVENKDGNYVSHLLCTGYEIKKGACGIEGMPGLFEGDKNAETLSLTLCDEIIGLEVVLNYVVFEEYNIIARSACLFK